MSSTQENNLPPDVLPVVEPPQETPAEQPKESRLVYNFAVSQPFSSLIEDEFDYGSAQRPGVETAFMPSMTVASTSDRIKELPKEELSNDPKSREWLGVVSSGIEFSTYSEGFVSAALDEGAQFVQEVDSPQGPLSAGAPKYRVKEGVKFSGEKARLRVRQSLNLGVIFNIPLWHSGFWIRLKAPSEGALLELYREITSDKVTLGRATYGLLFSNNTSYASRALLDFCIDHLYETSLDLKEDEDLRSHIKTLDLPVLFWGLACSIWPNGFQYMRSCISDPEKCQHVIKEKLDLKKLQFSNKAQLTQRQITHMTRRERGSMTLESVQRYSDEFIKGQLREVVINDSVKMKFQVPSALQHIESGYRWINAIEENYGRALTMDETRRDKYLLSQGKATVMRQYGHFVKSITVGGEEYDDQETIEDILSDLTASDDVRDKFLKAASKFIDDSVISMIAIPTFVCPSCGGEQKPAKENTKHPGLLPLDVNNVFFALAVQRIRRIEAR